VAGFLILQIDFSVIWRYFAWVNQTLAVFTLWALTVYLVLNKKLYIITLIPALFMTAVCSTYIFIAPEGLALSTSVSQQAGLAVTLITFAAFIFWKIKRDAGNQGA
jgi:carbon starvation protein CstA